MTAESARIGQFVQYFTDEELLALFRVAFKPSLDDSANVKGSIDEKEIRDLALRQQNPRIDMKYLLEVTSYSTWSPFMT
jgi:hypothetical protein